MSEVQPTLETKTIFPSRKRQRQIDDDDQHIEPPHKRARKQSPDRASVVPPLLMPINPPPPPEFEATEYRRPRARMPPPALIPRSSLYGITPPYAVAETPESSSMIDTPAERPFAPNDQAGTSEQLGSESIFSDAINEFFSTTNAPLAEQACEPVSDEAMQDISIQRWLRDVNAETTPQVAEQLQEELEYNIAIGLMQSYDNDSPGPIDPAAMALMVSGQSAEDQRLEGIGALQPNPFEWHIRHDMRFPQNERVNDPELMYIVDGNNRPIEDEDLYNFYNPNL